MIRLPPRSSPLYSSAASDVYKRQPVWREKLDFEGGELAGSSPSRRRGKFTNGKHQQIENTENMNKETQAIGNDMGQLAEDARALMAATADVAGLKLPIRFV